MQETVYLHQLCAGDRAIVLELNNRPAMRRRLRDLGLIEGTVVECVGKAPWGDPAAYLIRGAVVAIRAADSSNVRVRIRQDAGGSI